jgi:nicotinamidase-related amidase
VESHVCVLQTAVDLHDAGYRVIVVADCTGSRKADDKSLAMRRLAAEGIVPASYEQILFELLRGARAPAFRDISNLVK